MTNTHRRWHLWLWLTVCALVISAFVTDVVVRWSATADEHSAEDSQRYDR